MQLKPYNWVSYVLTALAAIAAGTHHTEWGICLLGMAMAVHVMWDND